MAKKLTFLLLLLVCLLAVFAFVINSTKTRSSQLVDGTVIDWQLNNRKLKVKVVTSPTSIEKGLGGLVEFNEADGMLFVFPNKVKPIFWMKEMQFAIDLYWLNNGQIIGVEKNMLPPSGETEDLVRYYAPGEVDMVLEIPVSKNLKFYSE